MAVRTPVCDSDHVGVDLVFVEGLDKADRFLGLGEDQAFGIFPPDLPHFHFKAKVPALHFLLDILSDLGRDLDVLREFLPDILSLEVEEVRGIDGKGGVPGTHLRIDQLFCSQDLGGVPLFDRDVICMKRPDVAPRRRCCGVHLLREDLRGHTGVPAGKIGFRPGEFHEDR